MTSTMTCRRTGAECGTHGYCHDCTLPDLEPWNVPHMRDKANDAHCSELLGTAGGAAFDNFEDPAPDSSRGAVQMLGVWLVLAVPCTVVMAGGLIFAVGRGLAWW